MRDWDLESSLLSFFLFFLRFIYLFMIDIEREGGRDTGGGRSRLHAKSPTWDSIPGFQDRCPGPKAGAKPLRPRDPMKSDI